MSSRKYRINDIEYDVEVNSYTDNSAEVKVNGVTYKVDICDKAPEVPVTTANAASFAPSFTSRKPSEEKKELKSPLPGVVVGIKVKEGDTVKAGQVIAILEAMKMENEIQAEADGVISSINVAPGESVLEGTPIVTFG